MKQSKQVCRVFKEIRQEIARINHIRFVVSAGVTALSLLPIPARAQSAKSAQRSDARTDTVVQDTIPSRIVRDDTPVIVHDQPLTFGDIADIMPEFPDGGTDGLMKFLAAHTQHPKNIAVKDRKKGYVAIRFTIECDGSATNPVVLKGLSPDYDREALRVFGLMPKWKPGLKGGKPVRVAFTIPITFSKKRE
jgi:TonB family protein